MKLIDKSALVAKIEKRRNKHFNFGGSPSSEYCHEDNEILGIINTLDVKEVEETVSEELEEAIKEHTEKERLRKAELGLPFFMPTDFVSGFKAGAQWQKKQMMAKTIDGDVTFDYYGDDDKTYGCIAHDSFCLEDFGLKDFDKVKMILIKED